MGRQTALITGASGFTGHYVTQAFEQAGYEVVGWGRELAGAPGRDIDLCDASAVDRGLADLTPDVVVHLAAVSFVAHGDIDEMYRVNLLGTRNLLKALAEKSQRPRRVILAGTANIYGNVEGVVDEHSPPRPQNDYSVSKLAMEHMARLWSPPLGITVARPFNYTGVGQSERFLVAKIVAHFKRREPLLELGNIDVIRDFNDVRNIADAYLAFAEGGAEWEVLNLCSGREYSIRDIIATLERICGYRPEIRINPAFVRANDVKRLVGNPARLEARLGRPVEFSLEQTLRWMLTS